MGLKLIFLSVILIILQTKILCYNQTIIFDDTEADNDFEKETFEKPLPDTHCIKSNSTITLNLNNTGLQLIYKGFVNVSPITCLNLKGNNIMVIPNGTFDNLPNLTYLNLARNNIAAEKLLSFGSHKNLQALVLDENSKSDFYGKLTHEKFPNLQHLYLRNNKLRHLNISNDSFPNLTHLYISGNSGEYNRYLANIPKSVLHLEFEKSNIEWFNVSSLHDITSLFIGGNDFNSLGCVSGRCLYPVNKLSLKILSVSHCYIRSILPGAFEGSYNLEKIDLSFNSITHVPNKTFNELKSLRNLSLSHNLLTQIPKEISLPSLKELYLSYNKIETISVNSLANFTGLETLSLRGNNIAFLPDKVFSNLKNLKKLDLAENLLQKIYKDWFQPLKNLKNLNMNSNQVSVIEFLYLKNSSLQNLYLRNNSIKQITVESMMNLPNGLTLHLGNIPTKNCSGTNFGYIGKYFRNIC